MYPKPPGYLASPLIVGSQSYRPFNGYLSGASLSYVPGTPTAQVAELEFTGVPADGSQITLPDGPYNDPDGTILTLTFTWNGSPGAGIIPLVAGGGTIDQAITAAQVAITAQSTRWSANADLLGDQLVLTSRLPGMSAFGPGLIGDTNIDIFSILPTFGNAIPGRFGKNYCWLDGGEILTFVG